MPPFKQTITKLCLMILSHTYVQDTKENRYRTVVRHEPRTSSHSSPSHQNTSEHEHTTHEQKNEALHVAKSLQKARCKKA